MTQPATAPGAPSSDTATAGGTGTGADTTAAPPDAGVTTTPPIGQGAPGTSVDPMAEIAKALVSHVTKEPAAPPAPAPPAPAAPPAKPPADKPDAAAADLAKKPLSEFPEEIRDYIGSLRKENGDRRTEAKSAATAQKSAEQRLQGVVAAIAESFGIKAPGEGDKPLTAEELTKQLTGSKDELRKTQVELATFRVASTAELDADADALLDSREFAAKIHKLDPQADDFAEQVKGLITETVTANPSRFKRTNGQAPTAAPPSGGPFAGGPGAGADTGASTSVEDHLRVIDPVGAQR